MAEGEMTWVGHDIYEHCNFFTHPFVYLLDDSNKIN